MLVKLLAGLRRLRITGQGSSLCKDTDTYCIIVSHVLSIEMLKVEILSDLISLLGVGYTSKVEHLEVY